LKFFKHESALNALNSNKLFNGNFKAMRGIQFKKKENRCLPLGQYKQN